MQQNGLLNGGEEEVVAKRNIMNLKIQVVICKKALCPFCPEKVV